MSGSEHVSTGRAQAGKPRSRAARTAIDRAVIGSLVLCGLFSLSVTALILVVLFEETRRFFMMPGVNLGEFLTGTEWHPLLGAEKKFGIWPLVCGTFLVAIVASVVAMPLGLISAVYLSEYAPRKLRAVLKPVLEILAGIPTVVYGFFALTVITPVLRLVFNTWLGQLNPGGDALEKNELLQFVFKEVGVYNVLSAGIAVGIMCLPLVSSLSEDALQAVPRALREGAFALGSTKYETSTKVVIPAALSGIIASFLLAMARAVGETMIVALAAGGLAHMTADPRDQAQTMTAYMVQIFLGDTAGGGVEYYSAYAVAGVLFVLTMAMTIVGHRVTARFREVYE